MKRFAPATERNRDAIASVLHEELPKSGTLIEIASGTGEHAAYLAPLFPAMVWQPSDPDPLACASVSAWRDEVQAVNLLPPLLLDAADPDAWPLEQADAMLCINMVHISPWAATVGLMRGARRLLGKGAPLILYGPYRRAGVETAPSNEAFDLSLRSRNPEWGLRTIEDVSGQGQENGLLLSRIIEMPANNLSLVFRKSSFPA